jgi:hypothetical protein
MSFEQKYLKYKSKYLELKNSMNGGFPFRKLFYKRTYTDFVDGLLRIGQVINFKGNLFSNPLNPDLPNNNRSVGNAEVQYIITNNFDNDVLVNIVLRMNINGNNYVFEQKDVKILGFNINGYKVNTVLNFVHSNTNENLNKLEFNIDSTKRFGQHSGEFTLI